MLISTLLSFHIHTNMYFTLHNNKLWITDSLLSTNIHLITLTIHMAFLINCWRLFTACRGRMDIWFKTVLLFVVFNNVHLYRQLMNSTCLELAKPSNKHLRLPCNDSSIYHCLLNGNSTNEFEICKMWIWIPEGKSYPLIIS